MATSCEPNQTSAYSKDIRWRIVWQSEALFFRPSNIAANLNVDESTVRRVIHTFTTTGDVSKRPYAADRAFRKITEPI